MHSNFRTGFLYKNLYIANLIIPNKKAGLLTFAVFLNLHTQQLRIHHFYVDSYVFCLPIYIVTAFQQQNVLHNTAAGPFGILTRFPIILTTVLFQDRLRHLFVLNFRHNIISIEKKQSHSFLNSLQHTV